MVQIRAPPRMQRVFQIGVASRRRMALRTQTGWSLQPLRCSGLANGFEKLDASAQIDDGYACGGHCVARKKAIPAAVEELALTASAVHKRGRNSSKLLCTHSSR